MLHSKTYLPDTSKKPFFEREVIHQIVQASLNCQKTQEIVVLDL